MTEISGRYVQLDGTKIYLETCGAGPPILLIHTAGRDCRQWHGVMERLCDRFTLIAPDLPGHGKSWPMHEKRCLDDAEDIAHWLNALMSHVSGERYVAMGCSLGGNLTVLMSAMFREVRAAIGLQGAAYTPTFTDSALQVMTHPQVSLMHANMDFSMSLVGTGSCAEGRAFSEWGVLSIIPLAQQADLRAYSRCNFAHRLQAVEVPVLLAHGSEDWLVTREMVEAAHDGLMNSPLTRFVPLSGLGHFPHLEAPDRVSDMVIAFLDEVDSTG